VITTLSVSCGDLTAELSVTQNWLVSLVGSVCAPTCPSIGSLPVAELCLSQLEALIAAAAGNVLMTGDAQTTLCG
jgi:hypothetical protein